MLASIWRYPVKSLRGESLESAAVTESGIPGDRSGALFVRGGHVRQGKTFRGKEHDRLHLTADVDTALALGTARGVQLDYHGGEHFFDDAPISMLLEERNAWMGVYCDVLQPGTARTKRLVGATTASLEVCGLARDSWRMVSRDYSVVRPSRAFASVISSA
jgi:uncharacterized protein YcbX